MLLRRNSHIQFTGSLCFVAVLSVYHISLCYSASVPSQENNVTQPLNDSLRQAILNDNVDISMNQKPGGQPVISSSSSNMLWQSSDNATSLYLHTNSSSANGWGGILELKRPGGGSTLGIKQPPEGGRPIVSVTGSTTLYESNGTSVGVNGMIDTAGNREGHMSIKRP